MWDSSGRCTINNFIVADEFWMSLSNQMTVVDTRIPIIQFLEDSVLMSLGHVRTVDLLGD